MSNVTQEIPVQFFAGRDGVPLAYREIGSGRPLLLIHGYFSNAMVNWIRYGHATRIAERGIRVIMPDLRGHGDSAKPHDAAAYPKDVLADDGFALLDQLGITDYDLAGYSLGGRTSLRMLARGAAPRRAIVAGLGLEGVVQTAGRGEYFRRVLENPGTFAPGSAEWMSEAFLKTVRCDRVALLHVLDTFVDTPPETLRRIQTPTLVVIGADDHDTGSAQALAQTLGNARCTVIPGNHMSAVTRAELGDTMGEFLAA